MTGKKELFDRLAQATIDGDGEAAAKVSQEIIDAGIDIRGFNEYRFPDIRC